MNTSVPKSIRRGKSCEYKAIEVSLNKVLRKGQHLPRNSHTAIVHCTTRFYSIFNAVHLRSRELLHSALCSSSSVIRVFLDSSYLCYTFIGYNTIYGDRHIKYYPEDCPIRAEVIRSYRTHFGCFSAYEDVISTVSSVLMLLYVLLVITSVSCTPLAGVYFIIIIIIIA